MMIGEFTVLRTAENDFTFDFPIRSLLRLCRVEEIIREQRIIEPVPSRPWLIKRIANGEMEGYLTDFGWVVFEDSFISWIKKLTHTPQSPATSPEGDVTVN